MSIKQKVDEFMTFTKNIKETGAVFSLPSHIVNEIIAMIQAQHDTDKPLNIVELGAGPGNITKPIADFFTNAHVTAYETNDGFAKILHEKFANYHNVTVCHCSAEKVIEDFDSNTVDVFISTIPLSTMGMIGSVILKASHEKLKDDGIFITAQYRTRQNQKIQHYIGPQIMFKKRWTFFPPIKVKISGFTKKLNEQR